MLLLPERLALPEGGYSNEFSIGVILGHGQCARRGVAATTAAVNAESILSMPEVVRDKVA